MDKKQGTIMVLLVVAILLSLVSIVMNFSTGASPIEFRSIGETQGDSGANIGLTINEPVLDELNESLDEGDEDGYR